MKLILGQFPMAQAEELKRALADMQNWNKHIIMPYVGDPVQIIDLPRRKRPWKRYVSLHAHRAIR